MITLNTQDSLHKAWLYRVLISIIDNNNLRGLYFKGGTCAAMLGRLDRFSIDLDFDYLGSASDLERLRKELKLVFKQLGLEIKDESKKVPQFFLKYPAESSGGRNTLKIDITWPPPQANNYELKNLMEINRTLFCQDIKTMFANKLVAVLDRYKKNGSVAGRDIYDIHYFWLAGYEYSPEVIKERTGLGVKDFFQELKKFVEDKVTETILSQDLNYLIPYDKFRRLRKTLKTEVLMLISQEINKK